MGNYLKVSANKLKYDAEKIGELNEAIPILIEELETSMRELSGCWEGPAWGAYQKTVAEYIGMLSEIYNYMGQYTITMQEAAKKYVYAEQDVCADIRGLNMLF